MGEADRYIERKIKKISLGDDTNAVMALIGINGLIFIVFGMIQVIYQMSDSSVTAFQYQILRFAIVPAKLTNLVYEPWTLFTYMFVHTGIILTIVNLLWLWAFGSILQNIAGNKVVIPIYLYGGFAGAIFFIAASYAVPSLHNQVEYLTLAGASASILAMAGAVTTMAPKYKLFPMLNGGIPLWVVTLAYTFICVVSVASQPDQLAALAGGGLMGFLFMYLYERGNNLGLWMNELYDWFNGLFDPDRKRKKVIDIRDSLFYQTAGRTPFIKQPEVTQEKIDAILDKINQEGYDHLSEEEKTILKKASEEDF